jgi:predicted outer membrane repeat protein
LFSIASISAGDVNDTAIANENQDSVDANVATAEVDNEKIENDVISSSSEDILGEKDNGTFTVLQNKINNVGDASTITLENDYAYTVSDDDALKKGIVVDGDQLIGDKTFTINGNGHIINGNKTARMFTLINDARLVLKNLTLTQGQGSDENIRGMIENVGGAIYSKHAKLTVINCTLTYNSADAWGGAIYAIDSSIHITDSQIAWNNAHCGAIYGDHCHINITDSQLTNNTAKSGGAIFGDYCHINITDSQLTNNTAGYGGAIFVSDCCVDITGSNIMLNTATEGGAIEAFGSLDYSYWVRITSSDITQNGATTGEQYMH